MIERRSECENTQKLGLADADNHRSHNFGLGRVCSTDACKRLDEVPWKGAEGAIVADTNEVITNFTEITGQIYEKCFFDKRVVVKPIDSINRHECQFLTMLAVCVKASA